MASKGSTTTPTRAVGYVRISKDRDDETSTTTQEQAIRAHCAAHGLTVVDVIVEPGRSGFKASRTNRPGFRRTMNLVRSGAADTFVCWKLDRVARNAEDILALVRELGESGTQLASVTEGFDTATATGRMMVTMLSGLAEMESATKSERIGAWQAHRRAIGATPTGPRPYGYRRERNVLTIDKHEAAVIRRAAKQVLAGKSLRAIVADLNAAGTLGKDGKPFNRRGLAAILTGPTIAACREVDGTFVPSTEWKAILDRDDWDEVRAILLDPARRTGPGNTRRWLLSGVATCEKCATPMGCKPHTAGPRYYCPTCGLSIDATKTEEVVEHDLLALLDVKAWRRLRRGQPTKVDTTGFEEAMAELTARFVAGDVDAVELATLADGLRRQQEAGSAPSVQLPDVPDVVKAWPSLSVEQRRLVLTAATESLVIRPWVPGPRFDEARIVWTAVE